ncbi:MAG: acetylglutamate kinase [Bdellovibrionota bacterium]
MKTLARSHGVLATLGYVKRFAGTSLLVKIGGAALEEASLVKRICEDLHLIQSVGISLVVVHGGGPAINRELTSKGIAWEFVEGQRVTTPEMMEVIEMVLCGQVNRKIVKALNQTGASAVGISGTDGQTLLCKPASARLGLVGSIEKVNTTFIDSIRKTPAKEGFSAIPVVAPIGISRTGTTFNINADWAASRVAQALGVKKMIFLTDQDGILGETGQILQELDAGELETLIETGVVKGGMLAKTKTILHALKNGVTETHILNARRPHSLIEELFTDQGIGTICRLRSRASKQKELRYA